MQMLNVIPKSPTKPKKFPKPKQSSKKFHKNTKAPPPACTFSDLRHFFCFILGVGLKKICKFFPQKIFFVLQFHLSLNLLGKRMVNLERNLL